MLGQHTSGLERERSESQTRDFRFAKLHLHCVRSSSIDEEHMKIFFSDKPSVGSFSINPMNSSWTGNLVTNTFLVGSFLASIIGDTFASDQCFLDEQKNSRTTRESGPASIGPCCYKQKRWRVMAKADLGLWRANKLANLKNFTFLNLSVKQRSPKPIRRLAQQVCFMCVWIGAPWFMPRSSISKYNFSSVVFGIALKAIPPHRSLSLYIVCKACVYLLWTQCGQIRRFNCFRSNALIFNCSPLEMTGQPDRTSSVRYSTNFIQH